MASYLIYLPGVRGANPQHLVDRGLDSLMTDGAPLMSDVLQGGPDGGIGMLCRWDDATNSDRNPTPGVRLDLQTWRPLRAADGTDDGSYWIGWENERPVRPEDIQRKKMFSGMDVVLNDGQSWHVPTARQLPQVLGIGPPRIKSEYKPFFDKALANLHEWLNITDDGWPKWDVSYSAAVEFCCESLAMNYRVNLGIVDQLELISTDTLSDILLAILDGHWLPHAAFLLQKKTLSEETPSSTNSDSGAPA